MMRRVPPGAGLPAVLAVVACLTASCDATAPVAMAARVRLTAPAESLLTGDSLRLVAVVVTTTGDTLDRAITWRSTTDTVLTVDATGLVRAVGPGAAWVVAATSGHADSVALRALARVATVHIVLLDSLVVQGRRMYPGLRMLASNGDTLVGRAATWSSDGPAVLTVVNVRFGDADAVAQGTAHLIARAEGVADTAAVTVVGPIGSVTLDEDKDTVVIGDTVTFTVRVLDQSGAPLTGLTTRVLSVGDSLPFAFVSGGRAVARAPGVAQLRVDVAGEPFASAAIWAGQRFSGPLSVTNTLAWCGPDRDRPGLICWGANSWGELGRGFTSAAVTLPIKSADGIVQIGRSHGYHHCGLTAGGLYRCWGQDGFGELGLPPGNFAACLSSGQSIPCSPAPVASPAVPPLSMIAAGGNFTCGLALDGQAWCWGMSAFGATGTGTFSQTTPPQPVVGNYRFTTLAVGVLHVCGLSVDSLAICWGLGDGGQLGNGGTTRLASPTPVSGSVRFVALAAATMHTCGLTAAGAAWCWGQWHSIVGGDLVPVQVPAPAPFMSIVAESFQTCALTMDGSASCWGAGAGPVPATQLPALRFSSLELSAQFTLCGRVVPTGLVYCGNSPLPGQAR